MEFILPSIYVNAPQSVVSVPVIFEQEVIEGMQCSCWKMESCWLMKQTLSGKQFRLAKLNLYGLSEGMVYIASQVAKPALLFILQAGKITIDQSEMSYCPFANPPFIQLIHQNEAKRMLIRFAKGGILTFYSFELSIEILKESGRDFVDEHPALRSFIAYQDGENTSCVCLEPVIPGPEQVRLFDSCKTELSLPAGISLWLDAQLRLLLRWYFLQHYTGSLKKLLQEARFTVTVEDIQLVGGVAAIIRNDLSKRHLVADLAKLAGMTAKRLQKIFYLRYKKTIYSFRQAALMEDAVYLLIEKEMPVKSTSLSLGYADPSDFTKAFKSFYGYTPTELLRKHNRPAK